jgi:DNA repair ATPase RecN
VPHLARRPKCLTWDPVEIRMPHNECMLERRAILDRLQNMSRRSSQGAGGGPSTDFVSVAPPPVLGELSMNASTMNIKSVHMVNFMMNEDVYVDFGNRLNFICGPNGSGKSTVLCAILIGLCGDTKNLGRASAEKTFIKSGKEFLKLTVTLSYTSGGRNDVVVSRKVTQTASASSIDGRKVSKEEVLDWVQKQNIQFDNLCHFMAQTRVRLFAQLAQKPKDFLLQVEEAVGPPGQAELHRWLISQNSEKQIAEKNKEQLQIDLERHKEKQKALDAEMQRYQNLIDIQKQLECAEDFRPHLLANTEQQRYDEKLLQIQPLKQETADKEHSLQGARSIIAQKRTDVNRAEKAVEDAGKSMRKIKDDATKKFQEAENLTKDIDHAGSEVFNAKEDIEKYHNRREQCMRDVQIAQNNLEQATSRLQELRHVSDLDKLERERKNLNTEMRKAEEEMNDAIERLQQLQEVLNRHQKELHAASSQRRRRFDVALERVTNTYLKNDLQKMYRFIEHNREQNKFRCDVYGPLAMELEFSDFVGAKVVQSCVPYKQRYVFLFADKDDFQIANAYLIQGKLSCTIVDTSSLPRISRSAPLTSQQLKQLGLSGFAMDLISDAPDVVKTYLHQRLSAIVYGPEGAVGSKLQEARQISAAISQGIGISGNGRDQSTFRFTSHKVVVRGRNVGYEQSPQNDPLSFAVGRQQESDTSALEAKIEKLQVEVEAARHEEEAFRNKSRNIRGRFKEIDDRLKEPVNLESQIKSLQRRHKEKLDALKELPSVEELEQVVSKKVAILKRKIGAFAQAYATAVNVEPQVTAREGFGFGFDTNMQELVSMMATVCCAQAAFSAKKKELVEAEAAIQEDEEQCARLQRRLVNLPDCCMRQSTLCCIGSFVLFILHHQVAVGKAGACPN